MMSVPQESLEHEAYRTVLASLLATSRGDEPTRHAIVRDWMTRHGNTEGLLLFSRALFAMAYADATVFAEQRGVTLEEHLQELVFDEATHAHKH